jgi:3-dehydroquinate synthetase
VARDLDVLTELVAAAAAMKAHVVVADPHERTGLRATLNLGHTLAHALESVGGYELLHGEAVAIGLVFAGALAGALERIDGDTVAHYRNVVRALDLPTAVPGAADPGALLASMRRDKKSVGGLTFVLPGPLGLETVHDPDARALAVAFGAVGVGDS